MPISKNNRANALLAPLNHFSNGLVGQGLNVGPENNLTTSVDRTLGMGKHISDMPSLEQLQGQKMLQPLQHVPRKKM